MALGVGDMLLVRFGLAWFGTALHCVVFGFLFFGLFFLGSTRWTWSREMVEREGLRQLQYFARSFRVREPVLSETY